MRRHCIHFLSAIAAVLFLLHFASCQKADHLYSRMPARFTMENIFQAPVLNTACRSMGQFCTITAKGGQFYFESTNGQSSVPITGGYVYDGFYLGLSGFIVGLPEIPEMGKDISEVVCFDLACSNCYQDYGYAKPLQLKENGKAGCKSCGRNYNLNDLGRTDEGRALFRYRVSLIGNTLVIANN